MCSSENDENSKLPYVLIDSNRKEDLPTIHLNHASDNTDNEQASLPSSPSSPGSPNSFKLNSNLKTKVQPIATSDKQKSSFFQSRKKQISLQPTKLLIPNLERSTSERLKRPTSSCSEKPLTAPITSERFAKPRASIAFDFNILHYLTKSNYFNGDTSFFGRSKAKFKFPNSDAKQSDLDSFGSVISLIERKEPNKKKKKKKKNQKNKNKEEEKLNDKLSVVASKKKKSKKVLKNDHYHSSSSSSSLLSLNNLSSSIEKLSSKFKSNKKKLSNDLKVDNADNNQILHKYSRVIVPAELKSKSMMQWSPSSKLKSSNKNNLKLNNSQNDKDNKSKTEISYAQLPPFNPPLKKEVKKDLTNHHHHSKNCHHIHDPTCINQLNNESNQFKYQFTTPFSMHSFKDQFKDQLNAKQLIKSNQQTQSIKFSFFKNKILRSRSFDTPKNSTKLHLVSVNI